LFTHAEAKTNLALLDAKETKAKELEGCLLPLLAMYDLATLAPLAISSSRISPSLKR